MKTACERLLGSSHAQLMYSGGTCEDSADSGGCALKVHYTALH